MTKIISHRTFETDEGRKFFQNGQVHKQNKRRLNSVKGKSKGKT